MPVDAVACSVVGGWPCGMGVGSGVWGNGVPGYGGVRVFVEGGTRIPGTRRASMARLRPVWPD